MSTRSSKAGPGSWVLVLVVGGILGVLLGAVFKQNITDTTPGLVALACAVFAPIFFVANERGAIGRLVQFGLSCIAALLITSLFVH